MLLVPIVHILEVAFIQAAGTATPSVAANIILKLDEKSTEEDKWIAASVPGTMYMASVDTVSAIRALDIGFVFKFELYMPQTASSVLTFTLAMTLYPDVQRRAQAEIDQIVGNSRLPKFSDEGTLPYVQAIVKEVLRWHPVAPLGGFFGVAGVTSL